MALSAKTLVKLGVDASTARAHAPFLVAAMRECDITTKARAEMFLAQLFHESIMLSTFEEIASGAAYEGRKDLGNVQRGDGVRFKGRGPIQVTGRANYKWMSDKLGEDFIAQPKLLATARYGYRAAAAFWTRANLNAKADKGDFEGITRSINGAATWNAPSHQARRVALLARIRKVDVRPGRSYLRRGDEGDAVLVLTRRLSFIQSPMTGKHYLDGKRRKFDSATVKALKQFQTEHALKPDGRFGPASSEALDKAVRRKKLGGDDKPKPTPTPVAHQPKPQTKPTKPDKRPAPPTSGALIGELIRLDEREDHILDTLIARGQRLERRAGQTLERERVVAPADLAPVKAGLVALSTAIDELQARIQRAEATPAAPATTNGDGAVTFAELGARVQQHDAEAELLRSLVRQRLDELEPDAKPVPGPSPATPKGPARTFTLSKTKPMKGADVKAFQRLLNLRFDAWNIDRRIAESGVYDAETREAARQVTQALGLLPQAYEHGITPALRSVIRTPSRRTPTQTKRAKARAPYRAKLRARYGEKPAATVATAASASVPAGAFMGSQAVAHSLAAIGHGLGLKTTSEKRQNANPFSGSRSDHDFGNKDAYAYDISDGSAPTPGMDKAALRIMHQLGFKSYRLKEPINTSRGVTTISHRGHRFRVQVIYRGSGPAFGGNHLNHIHIGVKRVG